MLLGDLGFKSSSVSFGFQGFPIAVSSCYLHCTTEELYWMHYNLFHYSYYFYFCVFSFQSPSSIVVEGFDSLRLLNLEDNCIADWNEILKLSQLKRYLKGKCDPD